MFIGFKAMINTKKSLNFGSSGIYKLKVAAAPIVGISKFYRLQPRAQPQTRLSIPTESSQDFDSDSTALIIGPQMRGAREHFERSLDWDALHSTIARRVQLALYCWTLSMQFYTDEQ